MQADPLVRADQARSKYGYTGSGYAVAIIDTGVDYTHSALGGGFGEGHRVIAGWDFVNNDANPMDDNGHGTHVAGIAAGNNSTYKGIAPDANIIALKVLDAAGSGSFGDVEESLQWIIANRETYNIVSVNMSLGTGNFTSSPYVFLDDEFTALTDAGVFIAVSSGNSFYSYGSVAGMGFPAVSNNVVSVGATWDANTGSASWGDGAQDYSTAADRITSFSQRSAATSIFAPGAMLTAAYMGGGFATLAGTSMAAPIVAGAAVLMHQAMTEQGQADLANQDQILQFFNDSGVSIIDGDDENDNVTNTGQSFKRIDLLVAMDAVAAVAPETPTPTATPISTPTATPTPEETATPTPSATPTATPTPEASPTPTPESSPTPSATPESSPTPEATPEDTPEATPTPGATPPAAPGTPQEILDFIEKLHDIFKDISSRPEQGTSAILDLLKEFHKALQESLLNPGGIDSRVEKKMKKTNRITIRIVKVSDRLLETGSNNKRAQQTLRRLKKQALRETRSISKILG